MQYIRANKHDINNHNIDVPIIHHQVHVVVPQMVVIIVHHPIVSDIVVPVVAMVNLLTDMH